MISKAPFFYSPVEGAPPVGDTRVLSVLFFLYVFLFSVGIIQIAASYSRMRGLSFFTSPTIGYSFGAVFIIGSNLMFFLSGDRNVLQPRLEGAQLLGWTFLGLAASVAFTLAVTYFIRGRKDAQQEDYPDGMEAICEHTYLPLIKRLWRRISRGDR